MKNTLGHKTNSPPPAGMKILEIFPLDENGNVQCATCHRENGPVKNKNPQISSHSDDQLINNISRNIKGKPGYFPLFDKLAGGPVSAGNISCPSCQNVHQWNPGYNIKSLGYNIEGNTTNSFLRARASVLLCKDCHGVDTLFRFKFYHDARKRKFKSN